MGNNVPKRARGWLVRGRKKLMVLPSPGERRGKNPNCAGKNKGSERREKDHRGGRFSKKKK